MSFFRHLCASLFVGVLMVLSASGAQGANPLIYALAAPSDPVKPGQALEFDVTLTNTGTSSQLVELDFTVPTYTTYQSYSAGARVTPVYFTLNAGASVIQTFFLNVNSGATAPPDGTPITLTLTDPNRAASFAHTVTVRNVRALDLQLSTTQPTVAPGQTLTYTLAYYSTIAAPGALVRVPLPAGTTFSSASGGGALGSDGVVQWTLGSLPAGSSGQLQLALAVGTSTPFGSQLFTDATFSDSNGDFARAEDVKLVKNTPSLIYALAAPSDPVKPGQALEFDVTLTNTGTSSQLVELDFTVPTYTTYQSYSAGARVTPVYFTLNAGASVIQTFFLNVNSGATAPPDGTPITLTLTDPNRAASFAHTVTVHVAPQIGGSTTVNTTQGQPFNYQIVATNNPTSYGASALPPGLSLDSTTGLISGTPTVAGTFSVSLSAANSAGVGTGILTIGIAALPPSITSQATATATQGQPFSYQITATNNPTGYGATSLAAGLSINPTTGILSGVPTGFGDSYIILSATNSAGTGTSILTLSVTAIQPVITSVLSVNGKQGQTFSYQITASNTPTSFNATGLPAGLSINTFNGLISGTPNVSGSFAVSISATNPAGTANANLSLTVSVLTVAPVVTNATASVTQNQPFSYQIVATNTPTSYRATGLPTGLSVNTSTGLISGTPTISGIFTVSLSATNAGGTGTGTLTLTLLPDIPTATLTVVTPQVVLGSGGVGEFAINLSAPQNDDLIVNYIVKGSGINGTDYILLKGSKKIKAGKTSKPIKIIPVGDLEGAAKKVVKLALIPGDGYTVGDATPLKVKIVAATP